MKPRTSLRRFLPAALASIVFTQAAHAATYYWDNNTTTSGLSTGAGTSGTWNGATNVSNTYATVPGGILDGTTGLVAGGTATVAADSIYFGTNNLSLGSTASTIGTTGTINIKNIVIGAGQTNNFTLGAGATITLAASNTIAVNTTSVNATIAAILAGTNGLTKAGAGKLILTSGSNSLTGGITISGGGTLQLGDGTSGILTSQALTFSNGGGAFNRLSPSVGTTQAMGALTFNTTGAGESTVQSTYGTSGTAGLSFTSLAARGAGATGTFIVSGGAIGTANTNANGVLGTNNIILTGVGAQTAMGVGYFAGTVSGSNYAFYDGAGFVRALDYVKDATPAGAGTATFSGAQTSLATGAYVQLQSGGSVNAQANGTIFTGLNIVNGTGSPQAFTLAGGATVTTNGILLSGNGGGGTTISGGTGIKAASGAEMVIRTDLANDLLTISTNILVSGASSLTKSGAGTLTLSGTNSYTGTTTINGGILGLTGGAAIADTGAVVLANAAGANLLLNNSETIGSLAGGGFSGGNVDVGANTLTLANANGQTFGGTLTGTGGLTINSGILTLSNKNTFAGTITLNGGQLSLTYGSDGIANSTTVSTGGTISMAGGTTLVLSPTAQVAAGVALGQQQVPSGGSIVTNPIVVSSGIAAVRSGPVSGGDSKYEFSGGVTGGASGTQTLSILYGVGGNGERMDVLFSNVIQNGGGTLGVNVDYQFASSTAQDGYVNLSAQNTFTGPIAVSNTKGLLYALGSQGGYLVIGGEISHIAFGTRAVTSTTGVLGWNGTSGNYTNTISLATGTVLDFLSNTDQILAGAITGGGNIAKEAGTGSLTLSAANTFTGTTTIGAGKIFMTNALALQNSAYITTGSNGTTIGLDVTSGLSSGNLTLGGLSGAVNLVSAFTAGFTGTATSLTLNPQAGSTNTYSGAIANGGMSLTKTGAGTQILSGANTYQGGTNVNGGTLLWSGANALPTTGTIAVGAAGNFSLADGAARASTTPALTLASGATMSFDWTTTAPNVDSITSTANITPTAGSNIGIVMNPTGLTVANNGLAGGTLITGGGSSTLSSSNFFLANNTNYTATLTKTATTVSIGTYTFATPLTAFYWTGNTLLGSTTAGADNALAFSTGAATNWSSTTTAYTATGLTPGSTANIIFANGQSGKTQQSTVLGADMSVLSLTIDDSTAVTIGGGNTLTLLSTSGTAGTVAAPASAISVTANANASSTISANVALGASQTWNVASGKTLNVSGSVAGAFALTKAGAGTLTLSGNNTYSGLTTISNTGTLTLSGDNIGMTGGVNLQASTTTNRLNINSATALGTGILSLQGGGASDTVQIDNTSLSGAITLTTNNVLDLRRDFTFIGTNDLNLGTGAATITTGDRKITVTANTLTIGGSVGDAGGNRALTKFGAGILDLSGANTYTGKTTVSAGILSLANPLALQNSVLDATNSITGTTSAGFKTTVTTLTLGGLTGTKDLDLVFETSANGGPSGTTAKGGYSGVTALTLNPGSAVSNTYSGGIVDGASGMTVAKSGTGTQILSGANTYTGATTVNGGKLIVNGDQTSANAATTVAAGTSANTPVASLGGIGIVGGNVILTAGTSSGTDKNGGVLSPTAAASGTALSVKGTTAFGTGSIFEWNMAAAAPGTDPGVVSNSGSYGQLAATGAITGSNAVFSILLGSGNSFSDAFWNTDKSWTNVFTGAGTSGINLTTLFPSFSGSGSITSTGLVAGEGQFTLSGTNTLSWSAVPEPTSALVGLLIGAGLLRRRRA